MEISIKALLSGEKRSVDFSYKLSLEHSVGGYKLADDATVNGTVKDMGGYMTLDASCAVGYQTQCARCLKDIKGECVISFTRPIALSLENEDEEEEYLPVNENSAVCIDEAIAEELIMSLPSRVLCSEDCKGLCPKCGADKNERECSCVTREIDPRWAALKNFKADK